MHGKSYRLNAETLGILLSEKQPRVAVMIPYDAVVTVVNGPLNGNRMVDVMWNGKIVMIFADDLRERGESWLRSWPRVVRLGGIKASRPI